MSSNNNVNGSIYMGKKAQQNVSLYNVYLLFLWLKLRGYNLNCCYKSIERSFMKKHMNCVKSSFYFQINKIKKVLLIDMLSTEYVLF